MSELRQKGWLKEIAGIYIIKTFMPFPLKEVNCFLAESDEGWIIIDTGVNLESNKTIWEKALKEIGISFAHIRAIYLTHYHHGHSGLAGWLQQKTDAPVWLPEPDYKTTQRYILDDDYYQQIKSTAHQAGWSEELIRDLARDIALINPMAMPFPSISPYNQGHSFTLEGSSYTALHVPGHSDGHCVFYSSDSRILFSGDNVIGHSILHISDWPHTSLDDHFTSHLQSLKTIAALEVNTVIPGHGECFSNLTERVDIILSHHHKRKAVTLDKLNEPCTAWELAWKIYPKNDYIHIKRLVLAETLVYCNALLKEGLISLRNEAGRNIYERIVLP